MLDANLKAQLKACLLYTSLPAQLAVIRCLALNSTPMGKSQFAVYG